jgi:2,3-bisphosphoglycerate-dependent phosphoglycerate mutase
MPNLVLLRHGESEWNLSNRFTGWTDVDLSPQGVQEAARAGELIQQAGLRFDHAHTSYLKRAIRTLWIVLEKLDCLWIPEQKTWRWNERHYGALQGLNKAEMAAQYGEEQVHIWRRSYNVEPPPLAADDARAPKNQEMYRHVDPAHLPLAESLATTKDRLLPYWETEMRPQISAGKNLLVAAHGNSIRALIKHLDNVSDEEITQLNIPTGLPLVYELDGEGCALRHYYLGSEEEIAQGVQAVVKQGVLTDPPEGSPPPSA